jgi:hypothetical protein
MPIEFRFSTSDKAICDELADKYGGTVQPLDGPAGGYEVVAVIPGEHAEDDATFDGDLTAKYDPAIDNCAGMPGCGSQRVLFTWYGPATCCPRCYENLFGAAPDPGSVITIPAAMLLPLTAAGHDEQAGDVA